jgi:hypothetical protein
MRIAERGGDPVSTNVSSPSTDITPITGFPSTVCS